MREDVLHEGLPKAFWKKLFPFQQEGITFGLERAGRVLLADEMGLGKTVQVPALCMRLCRGLPCV